MTFRSRLALAAAAAVVIAVLGACAAAYVASRDSLVGSIDGTLRVTAQNALSQAGPIHVDQGAAARGLTYQFVSSTGVVLTGGGLPVSAEARAAAAGHDRGYSYTTITLRGVPYRELIVGTVRARVGFGPVVPAAFQLALPLTSVTHQLAHLRWALVLIAIAGIVLAVVLVWLVGRTALAPLNDLTAAVEEVADTTDVSRRLDPGGPDELGRLRRAFNHLLAALDRSQQAQRQLVLDAGHELRTPLTSLRTNLEVVRRLDELPTEERSVLVDDVLTQMGELTQLVADLSELARGEQRPQEPRPFRLDRVVEDAVGVATTHGRAREVRFRLAAQPTWMRGQRDRVARAVGNLLDNALKWSPDGAVVEVTCAGGAVTVRDHGPGIAHEDLPRIFDRFYRAPGARRLPGSGLGLAIVAQVAEAEGGSISAGQAADGDSGAIFRLSFPTVAPPAPGWAPGNGPGMGPGDDEDDDDDDELGDRTGEHAADDEAGDRGADPHQGSDRQGTGVPAPGWGLPGA